MFGCHQQHELPCVHQKRKQHQIFLSQMDIALVTAAEPAMCYPERTSSARVSAASCHEQPQLTHVNEGRSLFTTYSLVWKPWPASHSGCFMLTTQGFDSSLGGKSVLERRQGWLVESVPSDSRDCHGGRQLNSSWAGRLEWDFSLHIDCSWLCSRLMQVYKLPRVPVGCFGRYKPSVQGDALPMPFSI